MKTEQILYEDNHLIIVNKNCGDLVQGDQTGDRPLVDEVKGYIKVRDKKPGNVFLGVVHRLDRPTSGAVLFAKTGKALSRMNELFRNGKVEKQYLALVCRPPESEKDKLVDYLRKNEKQNKSYVVSSEAAGSKEAILTYALMGRSDQFTLLKVQILTGRHHQIRCQLANIGSIVRGDLKYGAKSPLPDAGISLHAWTIEFLHPVKKEMIRVMAMPPQEQVWNHFIPQIRGK